MLFNKSLTTPENRNLSTSVGVTNQFVYTLPDATTKIWYENRDGDHAAYGWQFENLIRQSVDDPNRAPTGWGISRSDKYINGIVLSNSSTATQATEQYGSNTRLLDIGPVWYYAIRDSWASGYIQFFPEYQDYDSFDWFKVNQPYCVTSQGSSGSENEELNRCNQILKALKPEVREWMIDNQRVGDVVAYLMRSNLPGGYLNPINHRPVVNTGWDTTEDIALAASITIETIPPTLSINLISDSISQEYPNYKVQTAEVIGLKRSDLTQTRTIEVELICDNPNATFVWIQGQGKSTISANGNRATIIILWQANFEVEAQDGHKLMSNRMDVMAVAYDGTHYSCPVFISEYTTPEARELVPHMNEIGIAADDSFVCKLNGVEVSTGSNWQALIRKSVEWKQGNNLVEIAVTNAGGPGGLLVLLYVGEVETVTDDSWEASIDQITWKKPTQIIEHSASIWKQYGTTGIKDNTTAKWLWLSEAPETSTVYFRKTVVVGTPVSDPTPNPDQSAEITQLKIQLAATQIRFEMMQAGFILEEAKAIAIQAELDNVRGLVNGFKNALNEILK